jgi:hypothetical protein
MNQQTLSPSTAAMAINAAGFVPATDFKSYIASITHPGERYAGIILAADGTPSHHLFLLPGAAESLSWDAAVAWAIEAGGELPSRLEQSVLFGNAKGEFKRAWYWSNEQHADSDYAWGQSFVYGFQFNHFKSYEGRARVVRRLIIQ